MSIKREAKEMYLVWVKDYGDSYSRRECKDILEVQNVVLDALKKDQDPIITKRIPFSFSVKIEEGKVDSIKTSETKPDQGSGSASDSAVRRGDKGAIVEVDKEGRDPGADSGAGDKRGADSGRRVKP